jgi:hypothetical protein
VLGDVLEAPDDPVVSGTEVTFVVTVGNIGDTTTDDGNNSNGYAGAGDDVLIFFDIVSAGNTTLSGVSITQATRTSRATSSHPGQLPPCTTAMASSGRGRV